MKLYRVHEDKDAWTYAGMQETGDTLKKPCITVQPVEVGAEFISSKLPLGKFFDVQGADNSSETVTTRPFIEDQVDKEGHEILNSKTSTVGHSSSNLG